MEIFGGIFYSFDEEGLAHSSPLSPLLGAVALYQLDMAMKHSKIFYVRFMDDFIFMSNSRYHLREAIKIMYRILNQLELKIHPDKTQMGRTSKCFSFLGFSFTAHGNIRIAAQTIDRYTAKLSQLFKQMAAKTAVVNYSKHWMSWAYSVLKFNEHDDYYHNISALTRPL